jgi:VWFA-related protein
VDLPDVAVKETVWSRRVETDVVTNQLTSARAFVIIVDDVHPPKDLWAQRELKKGVANFVDQLGPSDVRRARVSGADASEPDLHARQGQTDRRRSAVRDGHHRSARTVRAGPAAPETMLYLAQDLGTIPGSRKVIVYFGDGLIVPKDMADDCGAHKLWMDLFATAQQQHVSIYPINTIGLIGGRNAQLINDDYLTVANETGGRAVINSNSFDEGIARIFAENDSYYLLAYQPTNAAADGIFDVWS